MRSTLTSLEAQLMKASSNDVLARTFKEQEAAFQQHPLYQQGAQLAINVQKLRDEALEKATPSLVELGAIEMRVGLSAEKLQQCAFYKQEAQAIREDFLQPVRAQLKRPSTPTGPRRMGQFALGVGENVLDTAKEVVNLPVVAAKFLGGAAHSLATFEDKLDIGEKITDASALINALCQEIKYNWENPEAYRERLKAAQEYASS